MIRAALENQTRLWDGIGHFDAVAHLVLRYGVERAGAALPPRIARMKAKECFRNATLTAVTRSMDYCEGYAVRPMLGIPIHHAWCVDASGTVVDPTWSDAQECFYLGVSVDAKTAWDITVRSGVYGLLTGMRGFNLDVMEQIAPGFLAYSDEARKRVAAETPEFIRRRMADPTDLEAGQ